MYGPDLPATASDVEKLRAELKAASDRLAAQQAELAAVKARVDEEAGKAAKAQADAAVQLPETVGDQVKKYLAAHPVVGAIADGIHISGFIQADLEFRQSSQDQLNNSTGQPINDDRFMLRRARLKVDMDYGVVAGVVEFDGNTVNGATARLINAEASVRWRAPKPGDLPYLQLTTGLFKMPFGFEILQSDKDRLFMERSNVIRALFPGEFDLGARLSGGWRFIHYAIAAMNGDPVGEKQFPGRDPNGAKDLLGRLGVSLGIGQHVHLSAALSGLYGTGFSKGTAPTKDVVVWRDLNEDGLVQPSELFGTQGTAATASQNFSRFGFGGDLQLSVDIPTLGPLVLYGELVLGQNLDRGLASTNGVSLTAPSDPIGSSRDLRQAGWYVGASLDLTEWAQVGFRYDAYNPDRDASDRQKGTVVPSDQSFTTIALVAAARYKKLGRLSLEYDLNTNHLGRDSTGKPANLADNVLLVRGQVVF